MHHWPTSLNPLAATLPAVHLHAPSWTLSPAFTATHTLRGDCAAVGKHAKSQGPYICWPIAGSGPCCLPWPPTLCVCLHRYMQLAPAAKCVHTTGSRHCCCLPWPLAVGPGASAEDPNSLSATVDTPQCFLKAPQLWMLRISVAWAKEISHFPNLVLSHTLILVTLYF